MPTISNLPIETDGRFLAVVLFEVVRTVGVVRHVDRTLNPLPVLSVRDGTGLWSFVLDMWLGIATRDCLGAARALRVHGAERTTQSLLWFLPGRPHQELRACRLLLHGLRERTWMTR